MSEQLCACGCGEPAPIANKTEKARGHIKGQPIRYILGHNNSRGAQSRKHGASLSPEYRAFHSAKNRCTLPSVKSFKDYGARGIEFRFSSFEQFLAHIGPRPTVKHSLDRINNDSHYMLGNVRWATKKEQSNNQRPRQRKATAETAKWMRDGEEVSA